MIKQCNTIACVYTNAEMMRICNRNRNCQ